MLKIGEILLKSNLITKEKIEIGLKVQKLSSQRLGDILQDLDFITSLEIAQALAEQNDLPLIDLSKQVIEHEAVELIGADQSKDYEVIAFQVDNGVVKLATANTNILDLQDFLFSIGIKEYELYFCDESILSKLQHIYYEEAVNPIGEQIEDIITSGFNYESVDAIELMGLILKNAINLNATDIHLSPDEVTSSIFFRIDGVMQMMYPYSGDIHKRVVSAIKVKSNMDIANSNTPQDGSMKIDYLESEYDFRVSSLPTSHGENVVIRILPKNTSLFNLNNLGFSSENQAKLEKLFLKPYGIVLVVGPTGSGKTTTLYSALKKIDSIEKNIITVEDPIEYSFSFIRQTQVNNQAGYTFHKALKYFMRQDPDVMLVGEIRDEETASLAVRASITGHMVLSTVHANTALDALPRLFDLKVEPEFLSLGLIGAVGQRLIRKLCPKCKEEYITTTDEVFNDISYSSNSENKEVKIFTHSKEGCKYCHNTGYKGRVAIIEILEITEEIKLMMAEAKPLSEISKKAKESGMKMLKDDAVLKLFDGTTSIEEINRVLN